MNIKEVPSPIDLRLMRDALEWERTAMDRPFREEFFEAITNQLRIKDKSELHILELGSGPGYLAFYLLKILPDLKMTLLDFSPAMHELATKRLALYLDRVVFIERSFKKQDWINELGTYDAVVTVQAVHELRHKHYAEAFHRQVKTLLKLQGKYLFCDHYFGDGGSQDDQLYMSLEEQRSCLDSAGYTVSEILIKGGRALYQAF